jgi:hypothetical protein
VARRRQAGSARGGLSVHSLASAGRAAPPPPAAHPAGAPPQAPCAALAGVEAGRVLDEGGRVSSKGATLFYKVFFILPVCSLNTALPPMTTVCQPRRSRPCELAARRWAAGATVCSQSLGGRCDRRRPRKYQRVWGGGLPLHRCQGRPPCLKFWRLVPVRTSPVTRRHPAN